MRPAVSSGFKTAKTCSKRKCECLLLHHRFITWNNCVVLLHLAKRVSVQVVLTYNLIQCGSIHVKHNGALQQGTSQFKERVQGQGGHVRLGPSFSSFLHILLKLDPSENTLSTYVWNSEQFFFFTIFLKLQRHCQDEMCHLQHLKIAVVHTLTVTHNLYFEELQYALFPWNSVWHSGYGFKAIQTSKIPFIISD